MTTLIRPEISKVKEYHISKHRYYELKHFCLQYPEWKKIIFSKSYLKGSSIIKGIGADQIEFVNPTLDVVEWLDKYQKNIELVEAASDAADPVLSNYILEAVTKGATYEHLKTLKNIPCSRGTFYKLYRKFFWYLDKLKN